MQELLECASRDWSILTRACSLKHTQTQRSARTPSCARAQHTDTHQYCSRGRSQTLTPQRKGEGPPPASRDVTWRLKQRRPPTIRGRVVSERDSGRRAGHILAAWCRLGASTSATTPHTTHATACCARRRLRCRSSRRDTAAAIITSRQRGACSDCTAIPQ